MSAYVFRRRMHGDIDTMVECAKAEWRRPRIVEHERRAALMSNGRNRRDVLHLKRERCRRFGEYDARVGTGDADLRKGAEDGPVPDLSSPQGSALPAVIATGAIFAT